MIIKSFAIRKYRIVQLIGVSSIILGLSLSFFPSKEEVLQQTKPISRERNCLVEALYNECRNCSNKEKAAVAEVVFNRVKHKNYPSTICGVVQQPKQFSYRNQFEEGVIILERFQNISSNLDKRAYLEVEQVVDSYLKVGTIAPNKILPENALHYHLKVMKKLPKWSTSKKKKVISLDKRFLHRYYLYMG
jgi:hypothetical protein